jgi:probable O-glycosylation ligase (exosortase A-associated)
MKGLIFTYALTAGGAVLGLFDPFYGLLVYVSFSILRPEAMWPWAVPQGNYSRIVGVALLLGWVLRGCGTWELGRGRGIVVALLGFWGWAALSAAQAVDSSIAWGAVVFLGKIILPFLVGLTTIDSVRRLKQLAWVIVLSQAYLAFELNLSYYGGYNRVWEDGFGGMDNNCVAIAMVTSVGLAFFLGLGARSWWLRGLLCAAALLMVHVILFSFSRGGMVALGLTGVVAFFLIPKKAAHYLLFAVALAVALRLAGPEVRARFWTTFADAETREASAQSRLDLWRDASDTIARQPVFGVGPDCWGEVAPEYGCPRGKEIHSLWFQTAADHGVPGMVFLAVFYGLCMVRLWPLTREKTPLPDPWLRDAARMVLAALTGFVVAAQFVSIRYLELPFYTVLLGAGVLRLLDPRFATAVAAAAGREPAPAPEPAPVPSRPAGFLPRPEGANLA